MRRQLITAAAVLALTVTAPGHAASVLLVPNGPAAGQVGDVVSLDIVIDFSDFANGALGGSFDITYESSQLGFVSVTAVDVCNGGCVYFVPPGPLDIDETGQLFGQSGLYNWAQLGLFEGGVAADGPLLVGQVQFQILPTLSQGASTSVTIGYVDGVADEWIAGDFVPVVTPDFNQILVTRVPLPAAGWLMLGGIAAIASLARKEFPSAHETG
jgi:hypothetical protein